MRYKMTQYNTMNLRLSNLQLNILKPGIRNGTKVTPNCSPNIIDDDEIHFLPKLLLTNGQFSKFCKASTNWSTAHKKFSKIQLSKIVQLGGFLDILRPLTKKSLSLPLIRNVLKPLGKSVLILLGLTAAASTKDAVVKKDLFDQEREHSYFQMKN